MPRRTHRLTPTALALVATVAGAGLAGCQDYNFSPVRYCLIQPGTERVTLSDISTADILFVVDDSGSMGLKQRKLADSFQAFIDSLRASNVARVASRLEPIDFHIAVTTTSVFLDNQTTATCSTSCGGAVGQQVCCKSDTSLPLQAPRGCATAAQCTPGNQCLTTCLGRSGELTCCSGPNASPEQAPVACSDLGAACGLLQDRYVVPRDARLCGVPIAGGAVTSCASGPDATSPNPAPAGYSCRTDCRGLGTIDACCADAAPHDAWLDPTCDLGVGVEGALYPRGDFVRQGGNPRVLHFTKDLFCTRTADGTACACTGAGAPATCDPPVVDGAAIATLITQFRQNVAVGTCGSGQEQGLEAARRAIQKALDGTQPPEAGGALPDWPHPRRVVAAGEKATSKLVVVFVGDEDDCSSPEDVTRGIIMTNSGTDACLEAGVPTDQQRRFKVQDYADFLASLGRPVAGAFIVSASGSPCLQGSAECLALCGEASCPSNCADASCAPAACTSTAATDPYCPAGPTGALTCGGVAAGARFIELSTLLPGKGADALVGSVCQPGDGAVQPVTSPPAFLKPGFSSILERVAEVVKQPSGLQLPTQPAAAQLTLLRIAGADGKTRKTCSGPAPAASPPPATPADIAAAVAAAEAAGYDWWFTGGDDTNRAPSGPSRFIYLNRTTHSCEANPGETYSADYLGLVPAAGCLFAADCQAALGGALADWSCDLSQGGARGTCLCGAGP